MSLELLKPVSENLLDELDENHLQGSLFNKIFNFETFWSLSS